MNGVKYTLGQIVAKLREEIAIREDQDYVLHVNDEGYGLSSATLSGFLTGNSIRTSD